MATYEVSYTPPAPGRVTQEFETLSEALEFAASVATPFASSVDIHTPDGPILSVVATNPSKSRRGK